METELMQKATLAFSKDINSLSIEEIRVLISQRRILEQVVPLAISKIEEDVFVSGDMGFADLLSALLRLDKSFWRAHPDMFWNLYESISYALPHLENLVQYYPPFESMTDELGSGDTNSKGRIHGHPSGTPK